MAQSQEELKHYFSLQTNPAGKQPCAVIKAGKMALHAQPKVRLAFKWRHVALPGLLKQLGSALPVDQLSSDAGVADSADWPSLRVCWLLV